MPEPEPSRDSTWSRGFYCFKAGGTSRPRLRRFGTTILLSAVLLAPSIWMLSVVPPLWRDVDAWVQVSHPPGQGTILVYGPLYPFVARIPLYLGYAIDCLRMGAPVPKPAFLVHPILTDSGVFVLLLSQHLALFCSAFYLITLTSRFFWIRLIVAVAWAANPLFYTFAHCVGSETLSMILLLLVGAIGLRIIRHRRSVPRKEWILLGILVWLCILSRHINAVLAGLLPLTFIILAAYYSITAQFARTQLLVRWRRLRTRQAIQKATVAFTVGLSCIIIANASLRAVCQTARIPYYSTAGFTFLFRLKFLAVLPPEKRSQLLDEVTEHTTSTDVKQLIAVLRNTFPTPDPQRNVMAFMKKAQASLFTPETDPQAQKFNLLLNRMEKAFLYPPNQILLTAAAKDFKRSQETRIPNVTKQLCATTTYLLSVPEVMPALASLWTFRDKTAAQIIAVFEKHAYFHGPTHLSYSVFLVLWAVNLSLLVALAGMRKQNVAALCSYTSALTLAGLFMMLANCVLNEFQWRYTLPMWELTLISSTVLFGKTIELFFLSKPSVGGRRYSQQTDSAD